ncbi:hypothetical protein BDV12DRAFT_61801 [Aspergillus spectabilis]
MAPKRAVRIANCSGAASDPGEHMYNQAKYGSVDVITGDYLAEVNLAEYAEAMSRGDHPGYAPTALDGIRLSLDLVAEKGIRIIINGGGLNPAGLAEETYKLVAAKGLNLTVAFVDGDDQTENVREMLKGPEKTFYPHLDSGNKGVGLSKDSESFLVDPESMPIVSANAYLGIRAIRRGLEQGADIIICGRVADASPVIAAAAWWHSWPDDAFTELAGAFTGGHLIECSTYVTGANFAGFTEYPLDSLMDLALPIVEIDAEGGCVVTKHEALNGIVTADTIKCQLVYELQGSVYLNSDVKADVSEVQVSEIGPNRVYVTGAKGFPPPPTTKLAVFYHGGYQMELTVNGCGLAMEKKYDFQEQQVRKKLNDWGLGEAFDVLDFQRVGVAQANPRSQLESTTYLRIFAQAKQRETLLKLIEAWRFNAMAHFAGMHLSLDQRSMAPKPFLGYYPCLIPQSHLAEAVTLLGPSRTRFPVGPPALTEPLEPRANYETRNPVALESFGETVVAPLGEVVYARSGDKGGNINIGLFVHNQEEWDWLRSFLTREQMQKLMGRDWQPWFHLERVEFAHIHAVHFVVYGPLGRGVSSSRLLDSLGKGFSEFIRAVHVPIPRKFIKEDI